MREASPEGSGGVAARGARGSTGAGGVTAGGETETGEGTDLGGECCAPFIMQDACTGHRVERMIVFSMAHDSLGHRIHTSILLLGV